MKSKDGQEAKTFDFYDRFFAVLHKISTLEHGDSAYNLLELHLCEQSRLTIESDDAETSEHPNCQISRLLPKNFNINEDALAEIEWSEDNLEGTMQKLFHSEVVLELLNPSRETIQAISMERGWK